MKVARHWVRELQQAPDGRHAVGCWGWSETSPDEARGRSREATARLLAWLRGERADRGGAYDYLDRPAREEVLEEQAGPDGRPAVVLTRNSYGSLVVNSARLMFVDLDLPPASTARPTGFLGRLFGRGSSGPGARAAEDAVLAPLREWSRRNPDVGLRLYRTAAGFRGIVTNRALPAAGLEGRELLGYLTNDPRYLRLCAVQECYRARVTPKPWRIGLAAPPARWPYPDAQTERRMHEWTRAYDTRARGFATCRYLETLGSDEVLPEHARWLERHDAWARSGADAPLA